MGSMRIGVPREVKDGERRVGLLPAGVRALADEGHDVWVERAAGTAVGFDDDDYEHHGATVIDDARAIWRCELIVKVKELQPPEYRLLVSGTTIFGYAQLARDRALVDVVLRSRRDQSRPGAPGRA